MRRNFARNNVAGIIFNLREYVWTIALFFQSRSFDTVRISFRLEYSQNCSQLPSGRFDSKTIAKGKQFGARIVENPPRPIFIPLREIVLIEGTYF